ncbi:MAG: glycogen/starch synthase [Alphaproteobacteria bacterium]|nr:glycogen/starch synthase [Alphaproteobacteria bacterium]
MVLPLKNNEQTIGLLQEGFNKKKLLPSFSKAYHSDLISLQKVAKTSCMGLKDWPQINQIEAWMLTAETATFMKWGGLGMVASELPENFNKTFEHLSHKISIVTPMYEGNTGKKEAKLSENVYIGAENKKTTVALLGTIHVPFCDEESNLISYPVEIYQGTFNDVNYIFLKNNRFFSINPSKKNPTTQDGCYVLNEFNINEVERFAFFSKSVFVMLVSILDGSLKQIKHPNILLANDWHSGALGGLCKYLTLIKSDDGKIAPEIADKISNLPLVHIAHHLGYQGWDYPNTARLLNSLYEEYAIDVFKNAKAIKNSNPRTSNTLIVYDCYNQASSNFHLADRVVTVSKNYMEEVSKELGFGLDFRDILKIRKNHRTFFGIVNGYEKKLISPNDAKIQHLNHYFKGFDFKIYDENKITSKTHNKKECMKLLSQIATDKKFKQEHIPLIDVYQFKDLSSLLLKASKIPFMCATSRLVEQKGYDIASEALLKTILKIKVLKAEFPVVVMGGAGDVKLYEMLKDFRDKVYKISPKAAERIFVFRGYKDEFAYALQLAADFYLMPSLFEPCGLTQMEAMAKGALPIATSTGGLVDTIENGVDGFRTDVFFANSVKVYGSNTKAQKLKSNVNAYADTLYKALHCFYQTPDVIHAMKVNAMKKDFSWNVQDGSVYKYYKLLKTGSL